MKHYITNKKFKEYLPKNIEKYVGTYPIVCRSSWELKICQMLDFNNKIKEWSSEGTVIKYFDTLTNKWRRYYPDFWVKTINNEKFIVEVKPEKDIKPNIKGKKSNKTKRILIENAIRNKAKFDAAKNYCKKLGFKFLVLTENEIFK